MEFCCIIATQKPNNNSNKSCARHELRENIMKIKTIKVSEFSLKEFEQSMVNPGSMQTYGDFIGELYKEEPYAKLEHEDVIYHESQKEQLIEHINELTHKK